MDLLMPGSRRSSPVPVHHRSRRQGAGQVLERLRSGRRHRGAHSARSLESPTSGIRAPMNIRRGRNEPPSARADPMKSWRNASPVIRGTPVDHYLRSRGNALTDKEVVSLRFSPALWHWPTQTKWPTMLARVSLATGIDLTTHQTFLKSDGSGKAPLGDKARLFAAGGCTLGGGVWFGEPDPLHEFVIGEGIESTLSATADIQCQRGLRSSLRAWRPSADSAASSAASSHIRRQR